MVLENLVLKGLILNQLNPSNVEDRVDPKKAFNEENKKIVFVLVNHFMIYVVIKL